MKKKGIVIVALIVVGVATTLYFVRRPARESNVLAISGNIEISDVAASFRMPGRVLERTVSEGERVKAGEILARLDDAELLREVEIRRAELGATRAALAELTAGFRREEINQARAGLTRARADAARAGSERTRQESLFARDVISTRELEASQAADRIALAQVDVAENQLALLERGPRPEQIDQARERVQQAAEALGLAETRLSYATLTSPLDGLVLAEHVESGEQVAAGTPVVTIGDLTSVWLRGYVDETDLGRVTVGQSVRVTTDTAPDRVYPGTVSFIASEAEFTPKSVQTAKERVKLVYRIKIDIDNPSGELKPGMPADAEIVLLVAGGSTAP
ncbi:MAG: HlyD family efflux transporter periplasmic adaptor subunit [Thermoanaerobaculia bacterium]